MWSPSRRLLTIGLIGLVTAVAFEGMAVPTILPATVGELGHLELYGWAFSAFWLTNIVGITLAGGDADRHGPGRSFALGLLLFAAGLLVSGVASGMDVVIAGRAIQGFGAGAIGAVVYAVIARAYAPPAMARMVAMLSSAWVVPGLVGPALAGLVAEHIGWRWVFLALVPVVVLMGVGVLRLVAALGRSSDAVAGRSRRRRALDAFGVALGSTLLLAGLGIGQPLAAVALLLAGAWLAITTLRHLLPTGSLRFERGRPAVFGVIFLVALAFFGTEAFVPLAVTRVRDGSTTLGGLALSASAVTWAIGSWLPTRLGDVRRGRLVGIGAGLIGTGIATTALVLLPNLPILMAALGWAIAGLGMGLSYSTLTLLVLETGAGQEGVSSSALQLMFTLGTALGAGIGGSFVALSEATGIALPIGLAAADALMVVVIVLAVVLAQRLPARSGAAYRPHAPEPHFASPAGAVGPYEET